jgi:hypothetical protein
MWEMARAQFSSVPNRRGRGRLRKWGLL